MSNPFANMKDNPFAKKKTVVDKPVNSKIDEQTKENIENVKRNGTAQDRIESIVKAVTDATVKEESKETVHAVSDDLNKILEDFKNNVEKEKVEISIDENPAAEEKNKKSATKEKDNMQTDIEKEKLITENQEDEPVVEEQPAAEDKPKKKRSKAKTAAGSGTEATTNKFVLNYDILGSKMSYDEILDTVRDYYLDSDWQMIEDEINERLSKMVIAPDMNTATLLELLSNIDMLNTDIQMQIRRDRQLLDSMTNKDFGVCTSIKYQNAHGTNDIDRKKSAFDALVQVPVGKKKVNYIYAIAIATMRLSFLENVASQLDYKRQMCITVAGNLKIENSLSAVHA